MQTKIYVPNLVIVEVAAAISRSKQNSSQAEMFAKKLNQIPELSLIMLDNDLAEKALQLAASQQLRGADAVYAAVAAQENCILVSLDKEQLTRLGNIVTTQTPIEAIAKFQTVNGK